MPGDDGADAASTPVPGTVSSGTRLAPLDGMRAAFLAVVMCHHLVWAAPGSAANLVEGAWSALDGFFVLSGFLIGGLLFSERARTGTIRYGRFMLRRILRLYPAMLVAVAAMVVVSLLVDHRAWHDLWPTVRSSVLYLENRQFGRHDIALFDAHGPGPVPEYSHLWSLALEFQFYLVLPLVLLALFALRTGPKVWAAVLAAIMAVVWWNRTRVWAGQPFPAAYVFTETRVDTLLWGVLLALAFREGWLGERHRRIVRILVVPALAWTAWVVWKYAPLTSFVYDWAMTISGLTSSILLAYVLLDGGSLLARFLGSGPMRWLGARSYSIYLYHFPVFFFVGRHLGSVAPGLRIPLAIALAIGLADASYRLVERPGFKLKDRIGRRPAPAPAATA